MHKTGSTFSAVLTVFVIVLVCTSRAHAGGHCPADLTGDDVVGVADLLELLGCWGPVSPGCGEADLTNDAIVGVPDLLELLSAWGPCPPAGCTIDATAWPGVETPPTVFGGPDPSVPPLTSPMLPPDLIVLRDILLAEGADFSGHVAFSFTFTAPHPMDGTGYHPNQDIVNLFNDQPFVTHFIDADGNATAWAFWFKPVGGSFSVKSWLVQNATLVETAEIDDVFSLAFGGPVIVNGELCEVEWLTTSAGGITRCDVCKFVVTAVAAVGSFWAGLGCAGLSPAGGWPAVLCGTLVAVVEAFDVTIAPKVICTELGYCP